MRIGIDARELRGNATGVGRYLGGLLREWARDERACRHEFVLYAHGSLGIELDRRRFASRVVTGSGGVWWEQVDLPRVVAGDHLDVFFAPAYTAPLHSVTPLVVAIHDLSFVAHPEWFRVGEGVRRRVITRRAARRASAVVTISEFSRREIAERLDVPPGRIHVIPPGITPPATGRADDDGRRRVLFVGSIFNRRHVPDLIHAFGPIARAHPDASLELVGDNRSCPHEDLPRVIVAEGLQDRVHWHAYVSDEELGRRYSRARTFAFLSEYEGLGLTPLEALAAGVPPVLADTPVARESCGEAALYVPVADIRAATEALALAMYEEATRARLLAAAPGVLKRYDWTRAAGETLQVIEQAADAPRQSGHDV
jgi:glycosyltransferase involved in cell wall biosynthesis